MRGRNGNGNFLIRSSGFDIPKEGLEEARAEELTATFEDLGLGDDEVVADDFEKLGLHGENVGIVEDVGNLGPVLVDHGRVVDKLVGCAGVGERDKK